jgi:hypothetical protein
MFNKPTAECFETILCKHLSPTYKWLMQKKYRSNFYI